MVQVIDSFENEYERNKKMTTNNSKTVGLKLFHGRKTPEENLEDWGTDGPLIGPLEYVQWTYGVHLKLGFVNQYDAEKFGLDPHFPEIKFIEDLIVHKDIYYGDFCVMAWADTVVTLPAGDAELVRELRVLAGFWEPPPGPPDYRPPCCPNKHHLQWLTAKVATCGDGLASGPDCGCGLLQFWEWAPYLPALTGWKLTPLTEPRSLGLAWKLARAAARLSPGGTKGAGQDG